MKQHLIVENIWHVIETSTSFASNASTSLSNDIFALGFENQKLNVKAMYTINVCICDEDQESMTNKITTHAFWLALIKKYKKKLQTTRRLYLAKFMNYKQCDRWVGSDTFFSTRPTFLDPVGLGQGQGANPTPGSGFVRLVPRTQANFVALASAYLILSYLILSYLIYTLTPLGQRKGPRQLYAVSASRDVT